VRTNRYVCWSPARYASTHRPGSVEKREAFRSASEAGIRRPKDLELGTAQEQAAPEFLQGFAGFSSPVARRTWSSVRTSVSSAGPGDRLRVEAILGFRSSSDIRLTTAHLAGLKRGPERAAWTARRRKASASRPEAHQGVASVVARVLSEKKSLLDRLPGKAARRGSMEAIAALKESTDFSIP